MPINATSNPSQTNPLHHHHHLPLIKKPTRPLRLIRLTITVLLLQVANDREHRSVRHSATATQRFGDAGAYAAEARVRGTAGWGTEPTG